MQLIFYFTYFCIAPHIFQFIKLTCLRRHYVYHHIYIIDQHPLKPAEAFMMIWVLTAFFLNKPFHIFRYGSYLWLVARLTDDKKICYSFIDLSQVQGNDILPFFILDSGYYGFDDL